MKDLIPNTKEPPHGFGCFCTQCADWNVIETVNIVRSGKGDSTDVAIAELWELNQERMREEREEQNPTLETRLVELEALAAVLDGSVTVTFVPQGATVSLKALEDLFRCIGGVLNRAKQDGIL